MIRCAAVLIAVSALSGCAANARFARDCAWPSHENRQLTLQSAADARHLADDAQTAEDIAIRHADLTGAAGRDGLSYRETREACKAELFAHVGRQHGVAVDEVAQAVGLRRTWLDALVMLAFGAIFVVVAYLLAGRLFQGAFSDSVVLAAAMTIATALALAGIGLLAGNVWSGLIESIRVGNGHMSYRATRVPWRNYPLPIFVTLATMFLVVAIARWKRQSRNGLTRARIPAGRIS